MDTAYNKNQLEKLSWMDCRAALEKTDTIIIPVGAVEQHGPHLPLGTDWMHAEYAGLKAAERCDVIAGPTIKIGVSGNHLDFPGTISFKPQTLILMLQDICECLIKHGFRRFIFFNGHGGNRATLDVAVLNLKAQFSHCIFGHVFAGQLKQDGHGCLEDDHKYHADEGETSRMLVKAPGLVHMDRALHEVPVSKSKLFAFSDSDKAAQKGFFGVARTKSVTTSGVFGNATLATPEKGEILERAIIDGLCAVIEKVKSVNLDEYDE
jgi:creatinine amidohydrolase